MKFLFYPLVSLLTLLGYTSNAQFVSARLAVAGLTCSLCSNSVEKSIRQLDFVRDLKVDLNDNTSEVLFKADKRVDINALAQKVYDAGFSVINLSAIFDFDYQILDHQDSFVFADDEYLLVEGKREVLNGKVELHFVGEKFLIRKEYKKWEKVLPQQVNTGTFTHIYFVTL